MIAAQTEPGRPTLFSISEDGVAIAALLTRQQAELRLDGLGVDAPNQYLDAAEHHGIVHIHETERPAG